MDGPVRLEDVPMGDEFRLRFQGRREFLLALGRGLGDDFGRRPRDARRIGLVPLLRADEADQGLLDPTVPLRLRHVWDSLQRLLLHLVLEVIHMEEQDPHGPRLSFGGIKLLPGGAHREIGIHPSSSEMGDTASVWRHRTGEISLDRMRVMGILNVTPDSFSDGGRYFDPDAALHHGLEMVEQGADLLDVGGESTRPGSEPVAANEEWRRIGPVIHDLAKKVDIPLSVDTMKPDVAAKAIDAGASIVNDVSGMREPAMVRVVAESRAGAVVMHMLGNPKTMQTHPQYDDVLGEVSSFLVERIRALEAAGAATEAIAVDPGVGFGKTREHNLALLRNLDRIVALGHPVVVGVSRKSFIQKFDGG